MVLKNVSFQAAYRGKNPKSLILLLFLLLSLFFLFFCSSKEKTSETSPKSSQYKPEVGYLAPEFTLEMMGGGKIVNLSAYKDKVVLLNFWASWCVPCRKEMPSMEELSQIFKHRDLEILAVNLDKFGGEKVSSFVSNYGLTFPILLDKGFETALIYRVRHIPTTYIIDKKGIIKERIVGGRNWTEPQFVKKIEDLIQP